MKVQPYSTTRRKRKRPQIGTLSVSEGPRLSTDWQTYFPFAGTRNSTRPEESLRYSRSYAPFVFFLTSFFGK